MFCCVFSFKKFVRLKFKLPDGTEIGPFTYSPVDSVAHLKSSVVSNWPKGLLLCPRLFFLKFLNVLVV